ncbi:MAG: L-threonine 3-dehydrogenase [Phycisphaerales bacterium]|nr:L-threonine 3-dehydrogenase [Phycisphaerales bacterium]
MSERMKAVRKMKSERGLAVEDVALPTIGRDDCLVRVEAAGICGTDLHIWSWDRWSSRRIKPPLTLGHEIAGTVVEVGKDVRTVSPGDYVSAESHITCGMCYQCRTGQAHMCPNTVILGVDRDGGFAEYVAVPEKVIWRNDREKIAPEIACLQEPFGNAVFATMNQEITGQSVAILGCGPIGLFSTAIARASGAARLFASDVNAFRLTLATRMGAHAVFNPRDYPTGGAETVVDAMVTANGGHGVDIVLEMSGAPDAITTAFRTVRNGGVVVLFGIPSKPVEIDVAENMIFKNLTVRSMNGRRIFDTWYKTRWLLGEGVVDLRPLITKTIRLEDIDASMPLLAEGRACKLVVVPEHKKPLAESLASTTHPADRGEPKPADANIRGTPVHR